MTRSSFILSIRRLLLPNEVKLTIPVVATNGIADVSNNFTLSFWALPTASHEIDPEDTGSTGGTSGERCGIWPTFYGGADAGAGVSVGNNGVSVYEHAANYMPATLVYPTSIAN